MGDSFEKMPTTDLEKRAEELEELSRAKAFGKAGRIRGAGGTPGGIGTFFMGLALAVCGGYLVLNQVQVTSAFTFFGLWGWSRPGGFGLTMLPMLLGIRFLFFSTQSKLGFAFSFDSPLL